MKNKQTFTQTDLIKSFAKSNGITQKESRRLIANFVKIIETQLFSNGKVSIDLLGFAKIKLIETASKTGQLPFKSKASWVKPKGFRFKLEASKASKEKLAELAKDL